MCLVCQQLTPVLPAGEPSLCYIHDGDGVCEPFERTSSILDCGPYTPEGYVDLWAVKAYASQQDEKSCPASLVTGEPVVKVSEGMDKKKPKNPQFSRKVCAGEGTNKASSGSIH